MVPLIKYSTLDMRDDGNVFCGRELFGQVGGTPKWVLEDESPRLGDWEKSFEFIFQLAPNRLFAPTPGAPGQVVIDWFGSGETFQRDAKGYDLFGGNTVYFFAVADDSGLVYVITQVD